MRFFPWKTIVVVDLECKFTIAKVKHKWSMLQPQITVANTKYLSPTIILSLQIETIELPIEIHSLKIIALYLIQSYLSGETLLKKWVFLSTPIKDPLMGWYFPTSNQASSKYKLPLVKSLNHKGVNHLEGKLAWILEILP